MWERVIAGIREKLRMVCVRIRERGERERSACVSTCACCESRRKRRGLLSFDLFLVESSPVTKEDLILGLSDQSRRLQSTEFKKDASHDQLVLLLLE